jgi:hypothetical protein
MGSDISHRAFYAKLELAPVVGPSAGMRTLRFLVVENEFLLDQEGGQQTVKDKGVQKFVVAEGTPPFPSPRPPSPVFLDWGGIERFFSNAAGLDIPRPRHIFQIAILGASTILPARTREILHSLRRLHDGPEGGGYAFLLDRVNAYSNKWDNTKTMVHPTCRERVPLIAEPGPRKPAESVRMRPERGAPQESRGAHARGLKAGEKTWRKKGIGLALPARRIPCGRASISKRGGSGTGYGDRACGGRRRILSTPAQRVPLVRLLQFKRRTTSPRKLFRARVVRQPLRTSSAVLRGTLRITPRSATPPHPKQQQCHHGQQEQEQQESCAVPGYASSSVSDVAPQPTCDETWDSTTSVDEFSDSAAATSLSHAAATTNPASSSSSHVSPTPLIPTPASPPPQTHHSNLNYHLQRLDSLPPAHPILSITLKEFLAILLNARQTGRWTAPDPAKFILSGTAAHAHAELDLQAQELDQVSYRGRNIQGVYVRRVTEEYIPNRKVCVYGCRSGGLHQWLTGARYRSPTP